MKSKSPSSKSGKLHKGRSLKRSQDIGKGHSKKNIGVTYDNRNRRFKDSGNLKNTSPNTIRSKLRFKPDSSSSNFTKRKKNFKNSGSRSPGLLTSSKSKNI